MLPSNVENLYKNLSDSSGSEEDAEKLRKLKLLFKETNLSKKYEQETESRRNSMHMKRAAATLTKPRRLDKELTRAFAMKGMMKDRSVGFPQRSAGLSAMKKNEEMVVRSVSQFSTD